GSSRATAWQRWSTCSWATPSPTGPTVTERPRGVAQFIHDAARRLAGWSYDPGVWGGTPREHSTFDEAWARVVAGYGLAAVVYLFVGHAIANRAHRH
ncbi:hypothetical protein ACFYR1_27250, partial [Streptomyces canus]